MTGACVRRSRRPSSAKNHGTPVQRRALGGADRRRPGSGGRGVGTDSANQDPSLTAVERSMGNREIAEGSARTAVLKRRYNASVDDVWDAITTPDRINRFFLPVSGDFQVGGSYAFEGQASGAIPACAAPHLLRLQWTPP